MNKNIVSNIAVPLFAVFLALIAGAIFILIIGKDPIDVYREMYLGTFGDPYSIGQVFFKATPLIFTGLAVSFAFRSGLFNIGAEGQLYIGSFFTAWAGWTFAGLPSFVLIPLCIIMGFLGGALWGAIPGVLKAKLGVHEVINTIMLNFIALALCNYLVNSHIASRPELSESVHTVAIAEAARLPRFSSFIESFAGSSANVSFFIAIFVAFLVWFFLWRTKYGYEFRAVGLSRDAARYAGISVGTVTILSMAISGGLAGLTGTNFVMGYKYYFEEGFSAGTGFMGIAVALLGKNHPVGVILAALLFGALSEGRLSINATGVPKELVDILEAVIIIFVVVSNSVFQDYLAKLKKRALKNA